MAERQSPDPATLAGLLADPRRLRVLAAVTLGAHDVERVVAATGLPVRTVTSALRRLRAGGLVTGPPGAGPGTDGALAVRFEAFTAAARAAAGAGGGAGAGAAATAPDDHGTGDPAAEAVLRVFLVDGRLTRIPAARGKRRVVLDQLARVFEPGQRYPEREVNALLRAFHPDVAALRRHLVDEGFLSREAGFYWRSGGTVAI